MIFRKKVWKTSLNVDSIEEKLLFGVSNKLGGKFYVPKHINL